MRAKKWLLYYLILTCTVFVACGKAEEKKLQVVFQYKMDYWNVYNLSESSIHDQKEFEELAQSYIQEAEKLLGNSGWWVLLFLFPWKMGCASMCKR